VSSWCICGQWLFCFLLAEALISHSNGTSASTCCLCCFWHLCCGCCICICRYTCSLHHCLTVTAWHQTLTALSTAATNATGLASTAFQLGRQIALTCILSPAANVGLVTSTGWTFHNNSGIYGSNYLLRAREFSALHGHRWCDGHINPAWCHHSWGRLRRVNGVAVRSWS